MFPYFRKVFGFSLVDVTFAYQKDKYNPLVRKQQFNELDFFSYFGGLLGLFAGISMISIIEGIYWFTVRLFESRLAQSSTTVTPLNQNSAPKTEKFVKIWKFVVHFFKNSSIHGLQFLVGSNWIQRLLWTFLVIFLAVSGYDMISEAREKLPDSRIVAFDDNFKIIDNVSFTKFSNC